MALFGKKAHEESVAHDLGVLALRATVGGLMAGHGAQKLFGSFSGPGLQGTSGWLESMGFKPGEKWALMAGGSELGGGLLTAFGFLHPVGPIASIGSMGVAIRSAHAGKPIWVTEGGAELPVTNIAAAIALSLIGPGRYSLDRVFGIKLPSEVAALAAILVAAGIATAEVSPDISDVLPDSGTSTGDEAASAA